MQKKVFNLFVFLVNVLILLGISSNVYSQDKLKFSCSAQIAEALGKDVIEILKEKEV